MQAKQFTIKSQIAIAFKNTAKINKEFCSIQYMDTMSSANNIISQTDVYEIMTLYHDQMGVAIAYHAW